jgi:transposase-like protein
MSEPLAVPQTLMEAIRYFSDPLTCIQFFARLRWADGQAECPRCQSKRVSFLSTRMLWKCLDCKKQFSIKVGTIFEDSPIGLDKWMCAMFLIANCKNGVSSYEIARDIKVTQKSAWFMLHRIRDAMRTGTFAKLSGEVEVDETFIGGKARNMHKAKRAEKITGTGGADKEIVFGMVERDGRVVTDHVSARTKKQLQPIIKERIEAAAAIFSDALKSYDGLENEYQHAVIDYAVEYVNGNVHTNTIENFWSLLKRGLHGTYISVEPFHLFRYLDEQTFRYNERHVTDADRFVQLCSNVAGRRLTWNQLTAKDSVERPDKGGVNENILL